MVNCMDIHDEMFEMGLTECYECNDSLGPSLDMVTVMESTESSGTIL